MKYAMWEKYAMSSAFDSTSTPAAASSVASMCCKESRCIHTSASQGIYGPNCAHGEQIHEEHRGIRSSTTPLTYLEPSFSGAWVEIVWSMPCYEAVVSPLALRVELWSAQPFHQEIRLNNTAKQ